MCPVEGVGGRERLIIYHGMARLDCSIFIVTLGFLFLLYQHLEGAWPGLGHSLAAVPRESGSSGPGAPGRLMAVKCLELEGARCRQPWGRLQRGLDQFILGISG